ncbi:MAG: hypothetical protein ACOC2Y_00920 [Spirochaetota bacterium]
MKRMVLSLLLLSVLALAAWSQYGPATEVVLHEQGSLLSGSGEAEYTFRAHADGRLDVRAVSPDFAPLLTVSVDGRIEADDRGTENAVLVRTSVEADDLVIVTVSGRLPTPRPEHAEFLVAASLGEAGSGLTIGGFVQGELSSDDERYDDDSYVDWYDLDVPEDVQVTVRLSSDDFDTYLYVELPNGELLRNDDANGTDSALSFSVPGGGVARIGASSFGWGSTGSYTVEASVLETRDLSVGRTIRDQLDGDQIVYRLTGTPGQTLSIELRSNSFDTYLEVNDSDGTYLYNDDAGSTSLSRVYYEMSSSGQATITVSAWGSGGGPFTLEARPYEHDGPEISDGYRLSDGESVSGYLAPDLPVWNGTQRQRFTFTAERGERVEIVLRSEDFDSYLTAISPSGAEYTDDDSAGSLDSRLILVADESGTYELYASDVGGGSFGEYTLSFNRQGTADLVFNATGALAMDDQTDISGKYYDVHEFTVEPGRMVTVDVVSDYFDGYAIVREQNGTILYRDDDSGGSGNPQISFTPDRGQTLELVVTSYGAGATGAYEVTIYQ